MSDIDVFLAQYSGGVEQTAQSIRELIRQLIPDCSETLHTGWKVISYGTNKKFCAIAPHKKWVNLQFHQGASLVDKEDLLIGTGKAMRHAKVLPDDPFPPTISELLLEAAQLAATNSGPNS